MTHEFGVPGRAWQSPYGDCHALPASGFAWEFVRRVKSFREVWAEQNPNWEEMDFLRGMRRVQITGAGERRLFPCLWSASPDLDAAHADVAWHPVASDKVLRAVALPPKLALGGVTFDPAALDLDKTLILLADGSQELLLRDGMRTLQLHIIGGTFKAGDALFVDTAGTEDAAGQLEALACFQELRRTRTLLNRYFPPHPQAVRLTQCLQALDGFLANAEHYDIAVALFGEEIVERDWSDPGEHLKDRVRRLIIRGRAMMDRGFLSLLR